ncbi:MAG: hypothetical protein HN572_10840, partial [Kordiimonadaceae bacterium]|nr:hypothetical protein [Kordiimonadaceae bacterium]
MTANNANLVALFLSILSFGPYFYLLNSMRMTITEPRHVKVFFLLWLAFFTFEFYFLGPYSFIELSHEGNLNPSVDYYLTNYHDGSRFSHQFGGGQDLFTMLPGMQYFNPEGLLHSLFPFWIVILIHKLYFAALGFFGAYLIARHHAPNNRTLVVAIAATFPVAHEYLLNFSTNWGPGYAAIPLAVYACTIATNNKNFLPIAFLAGIILSAADPIHIFPPLFVAVIGFLIFNPIASIKNTALAFGLYILLSVIVWHEFLYANATLLSETARIVKGGFSDSRNPLLVLINGGKVLSTAPLPLFLFMLGLLMLAVTRSKLTLRAVGVFLWLILSYVFTKSFPWENYGLEAISKLSHYYMLLAITVLFIPILAVAITNFNKNSGTFGYLRKRIRLDVCILALALSALTYNKVQNFTLLIWFGGQSSIFGFEKLLDPSWKPKTAFRTVTLFERPPANNVAGMYNIDTFDGQPSLYLNRWVRYWDQIQKLPNSVQRTRVGLNWALWNGREYDIDSQIRLDLLAIANVRYLFSPFPLKSKKVKLILTPRESEKVLARPESFTSVFDFFKIRLRRIFDPGELYIYELSNVLPRVFAASSVHYSEGDISDKNFIDEVTGAAPSKAAIIPSQHKLTFPLNNKLVVESYSKVTDGFDINISDPTGGVVIINNSYLPFWKAWGDGRALKVVPA